MADELAQTVVVAAAGRAADQVRAHKALAGVLGARHFATDFERVLFAMVANRALDPCSKRACSEWATQDVAITGLEAVDEDHCYRAMDLLVDADTEGTSRRRCSSPAQPC